MDRQNGGQHRRMSKKSLSVRIEEARKSKATELDLSGEELSQLPEALGQLSHLQRLDLSGNQLTAVLEALRRLTSLATLYLHGNEALGLPMELLGPTIRDVERGQAEPGPVTYSNIISVCAAAGDR